MSKYIYVVRYRPPRHGPWRILSVCKTEELAREVVRKHKGKNIHRLFHSIKEHLLAADLETAFKKCGGNDVVWENDDGVYDSPFHKERKERREVKAEGRKRYSLGEDGDCDTYCNWS